MVFSSLFVVLGSLESLKSLMKVLCRASELKLFRSKLSAHV